MNEKLIKIEEQLNQAEEQAQEEISELQKQINLLEESKEQLADDYLQAKENFDVQAYTKASEEMRSNNDVIRLYEERIEHLKTSPVVTKEEYETFKRSILDSVQSEDDKARTKVNELLDEAETVRDALSQNLGRGNTLLRRLQRELYKEPEVIEKVDENGRQLKMASLEDKYQLNNSVIHNLNKMLQAK